METTDRSHPALDAELHRGLIDAFAFAPSRDSTADVDQRVAAAIAFASAGRGRPSPRRPGFASRLSESVGRMSRRGRVVTLLAGVLVLGGAGGGILGLYEGMVGSWGGTRTAWDLATIVGVSQTVDGYRVTIERAYADPNQLMLAFSVSDLGNRGWTQVGAMGATVTDEEGHEFGQSMAMSSPDGSAVAANLAWFTSPAGLTAGQHTLTVSIPSVSVRDTSTPPADQSPGTLKGGDSWNPWHDVAGPWSFTIPVSVLGGSVSDVHGSASVAGTRVRLSRVAVSPASVAASVIVDGPTGSAQWIPIGQFEHAGRTYAIVRGGMGAAGAPIPLEADDGTTNAAGEWTLRITELVGSDGGQQVRLQGPWILNFSMP